MSIRVHSGSHNSICSWGFYYASRAFSSFLILVQLGGFFPSFKAWEVRPLCNLGESVQPLIISVSFPVRGAVKIQADTGVLHQLTRTWWGKGESKLAQDAEQLAAAETQQRPKPQAGSVLNATPQTDPSSERPHQEDQGCPTEGLHFTAQHLLLTGSRRVF